MGAIRWFHGRVLVPAPAPSLILTAWPCGKSFLIQSFLFLSCKTKGLNLGQTFSETKFFFPSHGNYNVHLTEAYVGWCLLNFKTCLLFGSSLAIPLSHGSVTADVWTWKKNVPHTEDTLESQFIQLMLMLTALTANCFNFCLIPRFLILYKQISF